MNVKRFARGLNDFFTWESYRHAEDKHQAIALELTDAPMASGMAVAPNALVWLMLEDSTPEQAAQHLERCLFSDQAEDEWAIDARTASVYLGKFWS